MKFFLVISALVAAAVAFPQGYTPPTGLYDTPSSDSHESIYEPAPAPITIYQPAPAPIYEPAPAPIYQPAPAPIYAPAPAPISESDSDSRESAPIYAPAPAPTFTCGEGEVLKGDNTCARPVVTRKVFYYNAPAPERIVVPAQYPDPKVHYSFVFVRTADAGPGPRPIIAPAPEQKTLVYVLSKRQEVQQQEVIEVPSNPTKPELYFVQYSDGENANLPGGIDLRTALSQAVQPGQVIHGAGASAEGYGSHGGSVIQDSSSEEHIYVSGDDHGHVHYE